MHALRISLLVLNCGLAFAAPQGYQAPGGFQSNHNSQHFISSNQIASPVEFESCGNGLFRNLNGECVEPVVSKSLFLYNAPAIDIPHISPADIPDPKVHVNYVFVRSPDPIIGPNPLIVDPPQQKTLVYVLNKRPDALQREVIEVPANPEQPEVFFVNYRDGDNPVLPGGIDLHTALSQAPGTGQFVDSVADHDVNDLGSHGLQSGQQIQNVGLVGQQGGQTINFGLADQGVADAQELKAEGLGIKEEGIIDGGNVDLDVHQFGQTSGNFQNANNFQGDKFNGRGGDSKIPGKVEGIEKSHSEVVGPSAGGVVANNVNVGISSGIATVSGGDFVRSSKGVINRGIGGRIFPESTHNVGRFGSGLSSSVVRVSQKGAGGFRGGVISGPTVVQAGGRIRGSYSEQEPTVVKPEAIITGPAVPVYSKLDFDRVFNKNKN